MALASISEEEDSSSSSSSIDKILDGVFGSAYTDTEPGDKHQFFADAQRESLGIGIAINDMQLSIGDGNGRWIKLISPPLFRVMALVPPAEPDRLLQPRMSKMQETVASMGCYFRLWTRYKGSDADLPDKGTAGREWMHTFRHNFRVLKGAFETLRRDMALVYIAFLNMIERDVVSHPRHPFYNHYGKNISTAMDRLIADLSGDLPDESTPGRGEVWNKEWRPRLRHLMKQYTLGPTKEYLLVGMASLGELAVVHMCAARFRDVLTNWDHMHGMDLPHTRRIFEVFAYDMEPLFERKRYQLTHLFDKPGRWRMRMTKEKDK